MPKSGHLSTKMLSCEFGGIILIMCGVHCFSGAVLNPRIVNGSEAAEGEFPFMASLGTLHGEHLCGATILNENWVLTAAHCIVDRAAKGLSVRFGLINLNTSPAQVASIKELHVHYQYNRGSYENDIALLQVEGYIKYSDVVKPVKVPSLDLPEDAMVTLIGWGKNQSGGLKQNKLQKVNLHYINRKNCQKIHVHTIFESNICAGVVEGGKGQCTGDSGGPLLFNGYQHGIISWSVKPCAMRPYPGVMTKVAFFTDWITNVTGMNDYLSLI